MYAKKYKLNDSYTTYVIIDCEDNEVRREHEYQESRKPLEWKPGNKVNHAFHGKGVISSIIDHKVTVNFKSSKILRKVKDFQITFGYINKPSEISNLHLCY